MNKDNHRQQHTDSGPGNHLPSHKYLLLDRRYSQALLALHLFKSSQPIRVLIQLFHHVVGSLHLRPLHLFLLYLICTDVLTHVKDGRRTAVTFERRQSTIYDHSWAEVQGGRQ